MKMILAIVHREDANNASAELIDARFSVTRLASTGGFLMSGNVTLMMGVDDDRVDECLDILRRCCSQHTEVVPDIASFGMMESALPMTVQVGGATVFVVPIERFEKL